MIVRLSWLSAAFSLRPGVRRNQQVQSIWHNVDFHRQVAQQLSISPGEYLASRSIAWPTLDGHGIQQFNLPRKRLAAEHHGQQKTAVLIAAARFESHQAQADVV